MSRTTLSHFVISDVHLGARGSQADRLLGSAPVGALNDDLRVACLVGADNFAASPPRVCARHTWEASTRAFVDNITSIRHVDPESDAIEFAAEEPGFVA